MMKAMEFPCDFSPPKEADTFYERSVVNWFDNGICKIYALPGIEHTLEDAKKQAQFIVDTFGKSRIDMILDIRDAPPISVEARNFYGSVESDVNFGKRAIIVNSVFGKVIANFYLGVFKSSNQSRLFTNVNDAEKWIKREE